MTTIPAEGPRSLPALNDDNRAFWTGGAAGRLLVPRCNEDGCRRWVLPPRATCPSCGSETIAEPTSGRARVLTWTLNSYQYHPDVPPPNLIAIVVLDEQDDLRLATNLVHCEESDVSIDLPVQVLFEEHGEVFYPVFEPAGAAS